MIACPLQVKLFDTPCDVDRVREWGVGVVRHEVTSRDNTIQVRTHTWLNYWWWWYCTTKHVLMPFISFAVVEV